MEYRVYLLARNTNDVRNKIAWYHTESEAKEALQKYVEVIKTVKRISLIEENEKIVLKLSKFFRTEEELLELEEIEKIEL